MAKKKAYIVLIKDEDGTSIDSVHSSNWNASDRTDELNEYKWVKKAWFISPEMNVTDLNILIK